MPSKDPNVHREYVRKKRNYIQAKKYGISEADFDRLLTEQHGVCAVCFKPETTKHLKFGQPWALCIDHDHETGKVRGLLCRRCNSVLGHIDDSPELALALAAYLERNG